MPASSDHPSHNPELPSGEWSGPSSNGKERLKAFLARLKDEPSLTPAADASGSDGLAFGKRKWWLSYCCEEAGDASTLEEARKWNDRIVRELNRRIRIVTRQDWPMVAKTKLILELMKLRVEHNVSILNIDRALKRGDAVSWKWW